MKNERMKEMKEPEQSGVRRGQLIMNKLINKKH
jgi:hypothetical protein